MAPTKHKSLSTPSTVLFASASDTEFDKFRSIFDNRDLILLHVHTCEEALRCAASMGELPVVIADCDVPSGGWSALLGRLQALPHPPRLVVCSRLADERLWAEVLNLGGFDVLATPFRKEEVDHVVGTARDSWHFRCQPGWRVPAHDAAAAVSAA